MRSGGCSSTPELEMDLGVGHVEYRVEQHAAKLGARLEALRGVGFGTTIGTTA